MKFSAVVEVPLREKGKEEVLVQMHVTKQPGKTLVIGTNALPSLGYTLVCAKGGLAGSSGGEQEKETKGVRKQSHLEIAEQSHEKAIVSKRVYVAPGELKWIPLRGTIDRSERLLHSELGCIKSGLCSVDEAGVSEVPLLNTDVDPIVLKAGTVVGQWEHDECGYTKVVAQEVPADMLTLNKPGFSAEGRQQLLKDYLVKNRGSDAVDERELWKSAATRVRFISQKVHQIVDRSVLALNPRAVGYAYAFFRSRCNHVSIMTAMVPKEAKFDIARLPDGLETLPASPSMAGG
ncbi:hypothetical protein Aduo_001423 [Ancylostoma duodenale]